MVPAPKSRRSFILEALSASAGAWVALAGLLGLSATAAGCDMGSKYGGPPDLGRRKDGLSELGPPKYGG